MAELKQAFLEYAGQFEPYKILLSILMACVIMLAVNGALYRGGFKCKRRLAMTALLTYLFLVFCTTVFARESSGNARYKLNLFWSYRLALSGQTKYLWEIISNIVMFLPIGVLFPAALELKKRSCNTWQRHFSGLFYTLMFGFLCSLTIEVLQLILRRGLFEWDDMLSNTLGVAAGYWLMLIIQAYQKGR